VLRFVLNLLRRPHLRFGLRRDRGGRFRDPRFVSFLNQTNRRSIDTDRQDSLLRGSKLIKNILRLAVAVSGAWVVLESAKALSIF
jgi:hypothetical protein